jgi:4'-phosphopantetheinyl transferase EntD
VLPCPAEGFELISTCAQRFQDLLPAQAAVVEATPAMWERELFAEEESLIRHAVQKRRREFTAGRNAARAALAELGCAPAAIPIGEKREPIFPPGISGTITHTQDYCAVAVIRTGEVLAIGVDAELNEPLSGELRRMIVGPHEEAALLAALGNAACDGAKLAFSIKEAFYKAFYQRAQLFLDFRDAFVSVDVQRGEFFLRVLKTDVPEYFRQGPFVGKYRYDAQRVYSAIALVASR